MLQHLTNWMKWWGFEKAYIRYLSDVFAAVARRGFLSSYNLGGEVT